MDELVGEDVTRWVLIFLGGVVVLGFFAFALKSIESIVRTLSRWCRPFRGPLRRARGVFAGLPDGAVARVRRWRGPLRGYDLFVATTAALAVGFYGVLVDAATTGTLGTPAMMVMLALIVLILVREFRRSIFEVTGCSQTSTVGFTIGVFNEETEFGTSETRGYPASESTRILKLHVYYSAADFTTLEAVAFGMEGKRYPALGFAPDTGVQSTMAGQYVYFPIPDDVKRGKHVVQIMGRCEGDWWLSRRPLTIKFPKP